MKKSMHGQKLPLKGGNGKTCLAPLLDEGEMGLLLLLETGLEQVERLDKYACTQTRDGSADQMGDWIASFLLGGHCCEWMGVVRGVRRKAEEEEENERRGKTGGKEGAFLSETGEVVLEVRQQGKQCCSLKASRAHRAFVTLSPAYGETVRGSKRTLLATCSRK
jgi:hypothetical protein